MYPSAREVRARDAAQTLATHRDLYDRAPAPARGVQIADVWLTALLLGQRRRTAQPQHCQACVPDTTHIFMISRSRPPDAMPSSAGARTGTSSPRAFGSGPSGSIPSSS